MAKFKPESKNKGTLYSREWRNKNPEKVEAQGIRANNLRKNKRAKIRIQKFGSIVLRPNESEIIRHYSRGRDFGMIAVMTNVPVSKIKEIIDNHSRK